jgi:hypothetical protein
LNRIPKKTVKLLKNWFYGFPRCAGPAAEYCDDFVSSEKFSGFFGKNLRVTCAIFLNDFNLLSENSAGFVDF